MARTRLVNGERVPLTAEEEQARNAEEAARRPRPFRPPQEVEVVCDALLTAGVISQADIDAARQKLSGN